MISYRDTLYHHGILGMHWGVRRYQNPDGTLTAAGRKRNRKLIDGLSQFRKKELTSLGNIVQLTDGEKAAAKKDLVTNNKNLVDFATFMIAWDVSENGIESDELTAIDDIVAHRNYSTDVERAEAFKQDYPKVYDQYVDEAVQSLLTQRTWPDYNAHTEYMTVQMADQFDSFRKRHKLDTQSDSADLWQYAGELARIKSKQGGYDYREVYDLLIDYAKKQNVIQHSGMSGMHWGIRKYRNYDGTLTEAGRKRYGVGPARKKSEDGGRKLSRAERKAAKEIQKKASAKAAERKAKEMRDEARKALEELQKEREALDRARADREQNSATAEGNAQMRLNNELLKMRVEQLKTQREYDSLLHPTKQKVPLSKRLGDLADNSRKLVAFGKDVAELSAAIKKAKNGDTKSAMDLLKDQDALDRLKFGLESRKRTREAWAEADAKKNASSSSSQSSNPEDSTASSSRQERNNSESAWEAPASRPDYHMPALPPYEEPKSRKKKRKG